MVYTKFYSLPEYNKKEIFRYAGVVKPTPELEKSLDMCLKKCENVFSGKVCYIETPIEISGDEINFSFATAKSKNLSDNLKNCTQAVIFAATVGIEIDRLIRKSEQTNMAEAVWLGAVGAERIEALCDAFCKEIENEELKKGKTTKPRFSAGYGDLDLSFQKEIFRVLDCHKLIGLTLTESLIMSPSKSVTAIIGISDGECQPSEACEYCEKENCKYKKEGR